MKLVIVGNGATAVDSQGNSYVNRHTAQFLVDLSNSGYDLIFIEPKGSLRVNKNLQDGLLPSTIIKSLPISKKKLNSLCKATVELLRADFVYIFFPGNLPHVMIQLCQLLRKPYGIYLRGEKFSVLGRDAEIFYQARFICSVTGIGERVRHLNEQIVTIRPMLDISPADSYQRNFSVRDNAPWRLLFVGRLEEEKGVRELIEAALYLQTQRFPFTLSLVGGGPLHDELFCRFGNDTNAPIRILGMIDNKSTLFAEYEEADIFVLPTYHEGFPRVLYEAMIKSMVIMTTFVGGIPGLMISDHNCLKIPMRDPKAIAETITTITTNVKNMQRLSENARKTVLTVLSNYPSHLEAILGKINV